MQNKNDFILLRNYKKKKKSLKLWLQTGKHSYKMLEKKKKWEDWKREQGGQYPEGHSNNNKLHGHQYTR